MSIAVLVMMRMLCTDTDCIAKIMMLLRAQDDWLDKAVPAITERTERYSKSEIRFNLMAVIKNRKDAYNQDMEALQKLQDKIQLRMSEEAGTCTCLHELMTLQTAQELEKATMLLASAGTIEASDI